MRVSYYPDTDSLFVKLKPGVEAEGSEVAPGIVFHYTPEGEVTAIDIDSEASKLVDPSRLWKSKDCRLASLPPYDGRARPAEARPTEAANLEPRLSDLVNEACRPTPPEEIDLLRANARPRLLREVQEEDEVSPAR